MFSVAPSLHPKLAAQLATLTGIAQLLDPFLEIVLHDLETGKIAAIYNDLSRSSVGDRSAISKFVGTHAADFPNVFEPYYRTNWDGKKLKCVAVTIRDDADEPVGIISFNFDVSVFQDFAVNLDQFLSVGGNEALSPIEQFTEDWQGRVNECIANYLAENQLALKALTKEQKCVAVNRLYAHGLFNYRKAAVYIGDQLNVSRATIYNYLKEEQSE